MRIADRGRIVTHQAHADVDVAGARIQAVTRTATDVRRRMVVGASAYHTRPGRAGRLPTIRWPVGIRQRLAAGPFPDVAGHVLAAPRAAPGRVGANRCGGTELSPEIGVQRRRRSIPPGVAAGIIPPCSALPFQFAGQPGTSALRIPGRGEPVHVGDRVLPQGERRFGPPPVGRRTGTRHHTPGRIPGIRDRRAGDPERRHVQVLARLPGASCRRRNAQRHRPRRHGQPKGQISTCHGRRPGPA